MSRKPIIINEVDVSECKYFEGFDCMLEPYDQEYCCEWRDNCYYKQLKRKEQECEALKKTLNPKLKNAHCTYFEGQTGLCKAKEFTRCNPVGCKLYTIDELSTIVDLQKQLDQLKKNLDITRCVNAEFALKTKKYQKAIEEIGEIAYNNYENPEMERIFKIIRGLED